MNGSFFKSHKVNLEKLCVKTEVLGAACYYCSLTTIEIGWEKGKTRKSFWILG